MATSSSGDSTLTLPPSEQVSPDGTIAVTGASYTDSFAQSNPGAMYLGITDSSGTLSGFYPGSNGSVAAGSGSNSIVFQGSYTDVEDIINSLTYAATTAGGSDSIQFDIWNQAGVETTGTIPVTIDTSGGAPETWTGAVSGDWNTPGNWSGNAVPASGDTVLISVAKPNEATLSNAVLNGETIILGSSGFSSGQVRFNNVTLNSLLETDSGGGVTIGGTLTIGAQGTVLAEASGLLTMSGTGEAIVNHGLVTSASGGVIDIYNQQNQPNAATFVNDGSIAANGDVDLLTNAPLPGSQPIWQVTNAGSIDIGTGGQFGVNGTLSGGSIALNGTGALALQQPDGLVSGAGVTGFGPGDEIGLYGTAEGTLAAFSNGTLYVGVGGSTNDAIPLSGTLGLGNFQEAQGGSPGSAAVIAYAPSGGTSGLIGPGVVAPAAETVAQGTTLALNDVSVVAKNGGTIDNSATLALNIAAGSGTLYMNGASGSGTHVLSVTGATDSQLNADLASLAYVPASGASSDTLAFRVDDGSPVETYRWLPITITGSVSSGPALSEPSNETVAANGTVAVSGSYTDGFAQHNPGQLWLSISDHSGTLTATDSSGQAAAGSGTNSIGVSADYVDVNAILASLHYAAPGIAGSDSISFDVWNQAGTETTGSTAITIDPATNGTSMTTADFASPTPIGSLPSSDMNGPSGSMMPGDNPTQPIGTPLTLPQ